MIETYQKVSSSGEDVALFVHNEWGNNMRVHIHVGDTVLNDYESFFI